MPTTVSSVSNVLTGAAASRPPASRLKIGTIYNATDATASIVTGSGGSKSWSDLGGGQPSYGSVAAIQSVLSGQLASAKAVISLGYARPGDAPAATLSWDATSTASHNGITVFRPSDIPSNQPGRLIYPLNGAIDARRAGAKCDGATDDSTAILAACAVSQHVRIPGPTRIASDTTIPAGVVLHFDSDGSQLVVDSGKTISVGGIVAHPTKQVFAGSGTVTFTPPVITQPGIVEVWAGWFGAKGDSTGDPGNGTDNAGPAQRAINACATASGYQGYGGTVCFARGRYRFGSEISIGLVAPQFGITLRGELAGASMATLDTFFYFDTNASLDPHGSSFTVGAYDGATGLLTLTGLSGMSSGDVGEFIYLTGCSNAGNNGAFVIGQYIDATSVKAVAERGVANDGAGAPKTINSAWVSPRQFGIRVCSRDCIIEGIVISNSATKYMKAALETTQGNYNICTNNVIRRVGILGNNPGGIMTGIRHAAGSLPDCENHLFERVYVSLMKYASYYCPSTSGQAKKIVFQDCAFTEAKYGVIQWSGGFIYERGDMSLMSEYMFYTGVLDQMVISNIQSEGCARFWLGPGYGSSTMGVQIYGGRYSLDGLDPDKTWIRAHSSIALTMHGVHFDQNYDPGFQFLMDNDTLTRPFTFVAVGCTFPNINPARKTGNNYQLRAKYVGCFGVDPIALDAKMIDDTPEASVALTVSASGGVITCDFSNYSSNSLYADGTYSVALPYPTDLTVISNAYPITRRLLARIVWLNNTASLTWPANVFWTSGSAPSNPGGVTNGHFKVQVVELVFDAQVMGWFATASGVSSLI